MEVFGTAHNVPCSEVKCIHKDSSGAPCKVDAEEKVVHCVEVLCTRSHCAYVYPQYLGR
jgi:hypothetical protein